MKEVIKNIMINSIANPFNITDDGSINWNFIEADLFLELNNQLDIPDSVIGKFFDEIANEILSN